MAVLRLGLLLFLILAPALARASDDNSSSAQMSSELLDNPSSPSSLALSSPEPAPNYHLVGWLNSVVPGGGQLLLGDYRLAGIQFGLEGVTFGYGYSLSALHPLTIDGVPDQLPEFRRPRSGTLTDLSKPLYADMLQEFGIKYHMVNVFDAYREAAKRQGVTDGIDQTPTDKLFLKPFSMDALSDPWVYLPIGAIATYVLVDYFNAQGTQNRNARLTPYSNFLYAMNYGVVQPFGSGVPEEMFFRGFVQNEIYDAVPSPWIAIPATATLFALAHAPGDGRWTAGLSGLYLGYLAYRNHGDLSPGITVHFWGVVLLGIETILLNNDAQHTTPPTGLYVQVNY